MNFDSLREDMVKNQLLKRGIKNKKVIEAFLNVPRHLFIPEEFRKSAYLDSPVSIGEGQTISQPYIVALMTELLEIKDNDKILEVGTGSGYQSAILSYMGAKVYSIERIEKLAKRAKEVLDSLGYKVNIKIGDGTLGWEEEALFDKIIVTAASPTISPHWKFQLKISGRIVLPLGEGFYQDLVVVDKISESEFNKKSICGCVFVPLIGKYGCKDY